MLGGKGMGMRGGEVIAAHGNLKAGGGVRGTSRDLHRVRVWSWHRAESKYTPRRYEVHVTLQSSSRTGVEHARDGMDWHDRQ